MIKYILLGVLINCSSNYGISDNFINTYAEIRLYNHVYKNSKDSIKAQLARQLVLEKYNLTVKDFNQQSKNVRANPKAWHTFEKKLVLRLEYLETQSKAKNYKKSLK